LVEIQLNLLLMLMLMLWLWLWLLLWVWVMLLLMLLTVWLGSQQEREERLPSVWGEADERLLDGIGLDFGAEGGVSCALFESALLAQAG
jgi:hypothetical protein